MNSKNPIYLSSWSIRDQIKKKQATLRQLFEFVNENDFQGVEIADRHLQSLEENYICSLGKSLNNLNLTVNLAVSNDFTLERSEALQRQINYVLNMIRVAELLHAGNLRIYLGGYDNHFEKILKKLLTRKNDSTALQSIKRQKSVVGNLLSFKLFKLLFNYLKVHQTPNPSRYYKVKDQIFRSIDSVLPLAEKCGIGLAIENHWGVAISSGAILEIINYYSSPFLGTCPDFGNFTIHQDRYVELKNLFPYARMVHAKSYGFTPSGEEKQIDYSKCMALIKRNGAPVPITIEYEGDGDQIKGCLATRDLVLKYMGNNP